MPTTVTEAQKIAHICTQYIEGDKLRELLIRLDEEVGKHTDNDSLKVSLAMLRGMVDPGHVQQTS